MLFIDRLISGGVRFVLDTVTTATNAELNDGKRLREELLQAQMSLELGEIDEQEFLELERVLMERLREVRERELDLAAGEDLTIGGAEVSLDLGFDEAPRA